MTSRRQPFAFRLKPEIKEALEKAALDDGRPASNLIEKILSDWLKAKGYLPAQQRTGPATLAPDELNAANDE
jgi:hypothetical protein